MQLVEVDVLRRLVGDGDGAGQAGRSGRHTQHTATVGDELAVLGDGRAGVVDRDVRLIGQLSRMIYDAMKGEK